MASPDNSAPPRPASVPETARWDPKQPGFEWVSGAIDPLGRRHGTYRSWTRDGVFHGECTYDQGRIHGKNINFHPDGTIASEADWVNDVVMDSVFHRSDAPTTEPFAQAPANVWSVHYSTRDGKTNYSIRYYAKHGAECGPDGNPLPPRPNGVSADARWFPDIDRWVDGEIERGTNAQVGRWRWWERTGVLRHEEIRDARGEASLVVKYHADGKLESKVTREAGGEQRDHYFQSGALSTRGKTDPRGRQIYRASWFDDGELDEEQTHTYDGELLASVTEHGAGGVRLFEARREGSEMACVLYDSDGNTIAASGLVDNGVLHGTWRLFSRGVLHRELETTTFAIAHQPTGRDLAWKLVEALFATDEPGFETPAELAGIDAEPWAETAGAIDANVDRLPRLARGLVAADAKIRAFSLATIAAEVVRDGRIYPVTSHVVPYLARLLAHPSADRSALIQLLLRVGEAARSQLASTDDEQLALDATHAAVGGAWPAIYRQFTTTSAADRERILAVAELAPDARLDLVELARRDPDPHLRARVIDRVTALPEFQPRDGLPSLADKDPLVRAVAAIAIAKRSGPQSPREVVHALDEAIRNWREVAKRFAALPFGDTHVLAQLARAAGSICTPDARSLTPQLCAPFDEVDGRSAIGYGQGLLALAFGAGDRPFAKRFVEILDAIAKSRQFWVYDLDAAATLDRWQLPRTRVAIAALVAELRGSADPEGAMYAKLRPPR